MATTELVEALGPLLQSVGIPGAVVGVIAWTLRKLCLWGRSFWRSTAWPYIEKVIQAYLKRQETMEACQKQLTEKTIEIQQQVLTTVLRMEEKFPGLCQQRKQ